MMALVNILPAQSILATGAGPGGAPQVNVFNGVTHDTVNNYFALDQNFTGGLSVAAN